MERTGWSHIDMTVIDYCTEEVRRQGHDIYFSDGWLRVSWMLQAWSAAVAANGRPPKIYDAIALGKMIEPEKNHIGVRKCSVRVGSRVCPPPDEVPDLLDKLWRKKKLTPLEFYKAFEEVHPFVDGNGRTGKVLLNWLSGTLLQPIFPPNDLFGDWIVNP